MIGKIGTQSLSLFQNTTNKKIWTLKIPGQTEFVSFSCRLFTASSTQHLLIWQSRPPIISNCFLPSTTSYHLPLSQITYITPTITVSYHLLKHTFISTQPLSHPISVELLLISTPSYQLLQEHSQTCLQTTGSLQMDPTGCKYFCDFLCILWKLVENVLLAAFCHRPLLLPPDLIHFWGEAQFISNKPLRLSCCSDVPNTQWDCHRTVMKITWR